MLNQSEGGRKKKQKKTIEHFRSINDPELRDKKGAQEAAWRPKKMEGGGG